jgi:uncharacterized membrane protein YphA (DoxX/SURF4 family)
MLDILQNGLGVDAVLTVNRVALGTFFAISGYHKIFNSQRHKVLVETFKNLGIPAVRFNQWWVPSVEMFGGMALISGILAPFAAAGLFAVCMVAVCTDCYKRIAAYQPIDKADWLDDLLYLPEVIYLFGLAIVISMGPGPFTLVGAVL